MQIQIELMDLKKEFQNPQIHWQDVTWAHLKDPLFDIAVSAWRSGAKVFFQARENGPQLDFSNLTAGFPVKVNVRRHDGYYVEVDGTIELCDGSPIIRIASMDRIEITGENGDITRFNWKTGEPLETRKPNDPRYDEWYKHFIKEENNATSASRT